MKSGISESDLGNIAECDYCVPLTPGNLGKDCLGNGEHYIDGNLIECQCDECDYLICCINESDDECGQCTNSHCPNKIANIAGR